MLKRIRELARASQSFPPPDFGVTDPPALGTYVGWYLEASCAQKVVNWCREHGLSDCLPPEELHTTIMYSKGEALKASDNGEFPLRPMRVLSSAVGRTLERFGPEHAALVVRFAEFGDAYLRHENLVAQGLVHTYPDVHTNFHMTLSYTAGHIDPNVMAELARNPIPFALVYDREVVKPIENDSYA